MAEELADSTTIQSEGDLENFLQNEQPARLKANSSLPAEAWKTIDQTIVDAAEGQLNVVDDMRSAGLTRDISFGVVNDAYSKSSKFDDADSAIDPSADSTSDTLTYSEVDAPIPVIYQDFDLSKRRISSAARRGVPLEDDHATGAGRAIGRKAEEDVVQGDQSIDIGGSQVEGFMSQGDVLNPSGISGDWGGTPTNIFDDKNEMIKAVQTQSDENSDTVGYFGPYWFYLNNTQWTETKVADPEGDGNLISRERLQDDNEIDMISVSQRLADGEAFMFDPQSDVAELSIARDVQTTVMEENEFTISIRAYGVMGPRIKSDENGVSGIVKATSL